MKRYVRAMKLHGYSLTFLALSGASLLALTAPSLAVNLNDPDASAAGGILNYWDRGNTLPNVVSVYSPTLGNWCTGTLINSRTVLTASHCLIDEDTAQVFTTPAVSQFQVRFGSDASVHTGNDRLLSGVYAHREYPADGYGSNDIALLSLSAPVTGVTPVTLIKPGDPLPAIGSLVLISGYGASGTGTAPDTNGDGKRRIAYTNIGGYEPTEPGNPRSIAAQFRIAASPDSPDQFNLDAQGVPVPALQGQPGPGDSGGPLFLVTENGLVQIGTVIGGGSGYGAVDNWTPVQDYYAWIMQNNPLRWTAAKAGTFNWSNPNAWSDTLGRSETPNNQDGSFAGYGEVGRYYDVSLSAASAITVDMNPTVDSLSVENAKASLNIPSQHVLTTILDTSVFSGTLQVDGRLNAQNVFVQGGVLAGSGTIGTDWVVNSAGTVAPGQTSGLGTLTIAGNYQQLAGGTLAIRVFGNASDRLAVQGATYLDGTLALNGSATSVDLTSSYTVLTSDYGISGRFAHVTSNFLFLDPNLAYQSDLINVTFVRNNRPLDGVAGDATDDAVADAIAALGPSNPIYKALVTSTSVQDARQAFDALSGEAHASAVTTGYAQAQLIQNALLNRLRQPLLGASLPLLAQGAYAAAFAADRPGQAVAPVAVAPVPVAPRYALWGEGFGSWSQTRTNGNAAALDATTGGFVLGADALVADGIRLGLAGGYLSTSFDVDARLSSGSTDSIFGALYGSGRWGALTLRLGAVYTRHDFDVSRTISFPAYADATRTSYDGSTLQGFGEVGYRLGLGQIALEPFAGASVLRLSTERFQEQGGAAALTGYGRTYDLGTTTLGLRAEARLSAEVPLMLKGLVGWRHAYGDVEPQALLAFAGGALPFAVSGVPVDRDALIAEAGLAWQASEAISLGVNYAGQIGQRAQEHSLKGNFTWTFETR
ncbi:autotransporter outer membrane beta-barrel domain-containing protein [Microvirga puerhi]|uniref:Autotransporter domain-containing protein n=1 Tax=Microvirga puerhi TaxID=2876078 RepID=A0ABS7VK22_9HYPH|nr:autotransporter domain-containing protein [Microvirga puerhi]MBZ6075420.1 autotransporter domain-containing protein [Microvirga puerhi]